jgi:hypothetical protein
VIRKGQELYWTALDGVGGVRSVTPLRRVTEPALGLVEVLVGHIVMDEASVAERSGRRSAAQAPPPAPGPGGYGQLFQAPGSPRGATKDR